MNQDDFLIDDSNVPDDIYDCFVSGAKFGAVVTLLAFLISRFS